MKVPYSDFRLLAGEADDFLPHSGVDCMICLFGNLCFECSCFNPVLKHIADNKKGQGDNEAKKTGQSQEASSSQAPQHPGPGPNGHYLPQSRGGSLPPPSLAVTKPPTPRGYGMPGYSPGNARFPGMQPGTPRGPPNYR